MVLKHNKKKNRSGKNLNSACMQQLIALAKHFKYRVKHTLDTHFDDDAFWDAIDDFDDTIEYNEFDEEDYAGAVYNWITHGVHASFPVEQIRRSLAPERESPLAMHFLDNRRPRYLNMWGKLATTRVLLAGDSFNVWCVSTWVNADTGCVLFRAGVKYLLTGQRLIRFSPNLTNHEATTLLGISEDGKERTILFSEYYRYFTQRGYQCFLYRLPFNNAMDVFSGKLLDATPIQHAFVDNGVGSYDASYATVALIQCFNNFDQQVFLSVSYQERVTSSSKYVLKQLYD